MSLSSLTTSLTAIENIEYVKCIKEENERAVASPFVDDHQYSKRRKIGYDKISDNEQQQHLHDYFLYTPTEVIHSIVSHCDMVSLVQLASTCRRLHIICISHNKKWKALCYDDFNVYLTTKAKFNTFYDIYRLLYCSRILIGSYIYVRYFNKLSNKKLPNWLMIWASLSENPPIMKYGKERITRRIRGHYLKKLYDLPYGQVKSVYDLKAYHDVINLYPTRQEHGTIYFPWHAVRFAAIRKHGGIKEYESYLIDKCYRSRGYVERNYVKVRGSNPLIAL